jgi:hypothetical protein
MTYDVVIAGILVRFEQSGLPPSTDDADLELTVRGPHDLLLRILAEIDPAASRPPSPQRELVDEFDTFGTLTR